VYFITKTRYLNEEVNCSEPSLSVGGDMTTTI
jgi:hypothetical protein